MIEVKVFGGNNNQEIFQTKMRLAIYLCDGWVKTSGDLLFHASVGWMLLN